MDRAKARRPASTIQTTGPIKTWATSPGRCSSSTENTPFEPLICITMSLTVDLLFLFSQGTEGI